MAKQIEYNEAMSNLMPFSLPDGTKTIETRIKELPDKYIVSPNMPVGIFLQEAFNIFRFAHDDQEFFIAKSFNWSIIGELSARIDYLRQVDAAWWSVKFRPSHNETAYREMEALAETTKKELLHNVAFACADMPDVLKLVKKIKKMSKTRNDCISLKCLLLLTQEQSARLAALGSNPELIVALERCAEAIDELYAMYQNDELLAKVKLAQRDRAYTFCAVALEAVRRFAHFAFGGDRKKLMGYASEYFRKSVRKR